MKEKRESSGFIKGVIVFLIALNVAMLWIYIVAKERIKELGDQINYIIQIQNELISGSRIIDLTSQKAQKIGSGFYVCDLEIKKHLTGIKLFGKIINAQSVICENATFSLEVGEKTKEFVALGETLPGQSQSFSVYIPDVNIRDIHYGKVTFISSIIKWVPSRNQLNLYSD